MHPSIDQLLTIEDRTLVDASIAAHIHQCAECAATLHRVVRTRDALRELPMLDAPPDAWDRIQSALIESSVPSSRARIGLRRTSVALVAAASTGALALLLFTQTNDEPREATPIVASIEESKARRAQDDVTQLIEQSRELDALLQALPQRPRVERVSMAATLDTIENRIQWLDFQLSATDGELDEAQGNRLWQERVELMDSLVKVRYAQTGSASF
jgi:hypothetical protein